MSSGTDTHRPVAGSRGGGPVRTPRTSRIFTCRFLARLLGGTPPVSRRRRLTGVRSGARPRRVRRLSEDVPWDPEHDHDPLDDVDPRLTHRLDELADEYGPLGVLLVAASMWPDAFNALIDRLARS